MNFRQRRTIGLIVIVAAFLLLDGVIVLFLYRTRHEHSQDPVILDAARRYAIDPTLIKAVIWRESWFNPDARGKAGEYGLMQIREAAGREWAAAEGLTHFQPDHLLAPDTNTLAGTWYLAHLLKRYPQTDHPVAYALADYNAGRGNVLRWIQGSAGTNHAAFLDAMTFPGTRSYITAITNRALHYQARNEFANAREQMGFQTH